MEFSRRKGTKRVRIGRRRRPTCLLYIYSKLKDMLIENILARSLACVERPFNATPVTS